MIGNVDIVFGGQAGSEGKGKVAAHMVKRRLNYKLAVSDFSPNAGHTYRDPSRKVVVQQIPIALVRDDIKLAISPGSVLDLDILLKEIKDYDVADRLFIDPRACIVQHKHKELESEILERISSTCKGSGAALADKVLRRPDVILAGDVSELNPYICDNVNKLIMDTIIAGYDVILEGAQGFDLDLDHGLEYPFCTSRHTTPMAIAARSGVPGCLIREIWAVCRTYPIRVGNTYDKDGNMVGYSGDYTISTELSWDEIALRGGMLEPPTEITTVTGKVRRVFEFDFSRFMRMCMITGATNIAINFVDYLDATVYGANNSDGDNLLKQSNRVCTFIDKLNGVLDGYDALCDRETYISFIGTGPHDEHAMWDYDTYGLRYS
jgi:adenylosuccinate synthase